jgi:hypothetical protein
LALLVSQSLVQLFRRGEAVAIIINERTIEDSTLEGVAEAHCVQLSHIQHASVVEIKGRQLLEMGHQVDQHPLSAPFHPQELESDVAKYPLLVQSAAGLLYHSDCRLAPCPTHFLCRVHSSQTHALCVVLAVAAQQCEHSVKIYSPEYSHWHTPLQIGLRIPLLCLEKRNELITSHQRALRQGHLLHQY